MTSSPGLCNLSRLGTTNAQVFGWDGWKCDPDRLYFVREVVRSRFLLLANHQKRSDNINVFIKPEPHKLKKLREQRYRIISAVSLVDTLIDRILFGWLGRVVLDKVGRTPCMVGWSPIQGGWVGLTALYADKKVLCLDKSAWDWTVQGWLVDLWLRFVKEMAVGAPRWWLDMVDLRFELLFDKARFEFKDGTVVEQQSKGIMKSGCFLTIILNSISQSFLHYIACDRLGWPVRKYQPLSNGDDTVQEVVPDVKAYVRELESLGAKVKGAVVRNNIEFSGFVFANRVCWPAYWQKHLFNLQYAENLKQVLQAYQIIYVHEPLMFEYLQAVAVSLTPECVMSKVECLSIMDGI